MRTNNKGFTLIELVMVIVILGILAAVAIPRFANLSSNARESSFKGAVGAVKSAAVAYLGENQEYPPTVSELANAFQSDDFTLSNAQGSATDQIGGTPSSGTAVYVISKDGKYYVQLGYDSSTGTVYSSGL